jgi:hypothetical protein
MLRYRHYHHYHHHHHHHSKQLTLLQHGILDLRSIAVNNTVTASYAYLPLSIEEKYSSPVETVIVGRLQEPKVIFQ